MRKVIYKKRTTEEYLEDLTDGTGHLNPLPGKLNDKSPDYSGYIKIDNKVYKLSGWVKLSGGKKKMSIKAVSANFQSEVYSL